jgi:hypothetical protein
MNDEIFLRLHYHSGLVAQGCWDQLDEYAREAIMRFGELIVQECAEIADQERPNSLGCGYITKTKGRLIREHFGVEE